MKKLLLILLLSIAYLCTTHAQSFTKLEVKQSMRRVADWQIGHYNRAVYGDLNWVNATFSWDLLIGQRSPRRTIRMTSIING